MTKSVIPLGYVMADESIMSNLLGTIKLDIVQELESQPNKVVGVHHAWDYCGYVWFDGKLWHEEIWKYKEPVDHMTSEDVLLLFEAVKEAHGRR